MKRKHLIWLACIAAVLGIVAGVQRCSNTGQKNTPGNIRILPENFGSDNITSIQLTRTDTTITLQRTADGWGVKERYGYPADVARLRDLFVQLCNARVIQTPTLNVAQAESLMLVPEHGATTVNLIGAHDRTLYTLCFGSKHQKQAAPSSPYETAGGSFSSGRYLRLSEGHDVMVASSFDMVDLPVTGWLDPEFLAIPSLKHAVFKQEGKVAWELSSGSDASGLTLAGDIPDDREVDTAKINSFRYAFSRLQFSDVVAPGDKDAETALAAAPVLQLTDGDDFIYNLQAATAPNQNYYLKATVTWDGPATRTPGQGESDEDRKRLDSEFTEKVKTKREKAATQNARFSSWTFIVDAEVFGNLTRQRTDFLKNKPAPAAATKNPPAATAGSKPNP